MKKSEIIQALIAHYCDGNLSRFAKMLGVTPQTVAGWKTRESFDVDLIFEKCENVSGDWLLSGKGDMIKKPFANNYQIFSGKNSENDENSSLEPHISMEIGQGTPYYDVDFIGGFSEIFNSQVTVPACNVVVPGFEKAQLWCNVTGHSMEPKINHGDIIALRECTVSDIQYGEIYAVVLDTIRTIKILRRGSTDNVLRYVPINVANFDEQEYPIERILKVYEVLGSIARFF